MSRFYAPGQSIKNGLITVTGEEAHHITGVMRLRKGDSVVTFDGKGNEYSGIISEIKAKSLTISVTARRESADIQKARITLIQAVPKKDKMDYIVEKASELGACAIMPILSERSIPDWDDTKKLVRVERWTKIAIAASKQSGRTDVPEIHKIVGLKQAIGSTARSAVKLIATLNDKTVPLKKALDGFKEGSIAIAIGPEGDFTPREVEDALAAGFVPVSLGPRVLKSDTAGLAAIAIINYDTSD